MAINFSTLVYLPAFDTFSRSVIITPVVSRPGQPAYTVRGIFDTDEIDVIGLDGSIVSDQRTILDLRDAEIVGVMPVQGDRVDIPSEGDIPAEGTWEIMDADVNGGGETTLVLRRYG